MKKNQNREETSIGTEGATQQLGICWRISQVKWTLFRILSGKSAGTEGANPMMGESLRFITEGTRHAATLCAPLFIFQFSPGGTK